MNDVGLNRLLINQALAARHYGYVFVEAESSLKSCLKLSVLYIAEL